MHYSKISQIEPLALACRLTPSAVCDYIGLRFEKHRCVLNNEEELIHLRLAGSRGYLNLSFDGIRVVIEARSGDNLILKAAIRDRQLDASSDASLLTAFPNSDPACNRLPAPGFLAAELSIYSYDERTILPGAEQRGTIANFVSDPDSYIWRDFCQDRFFPLFEQAFFLNRAPWQTALPMSGVPAEFVRKAESLLAELGYHRVDAVPSWYNVATFFDRLGYDFTYGEHAAAFRSLRTSLEKRWSGVTMSQKSWLVALQNIPDAYIPKALRLSQRWPVTHTNMYWVRMHRELNPFEAPLRESPLMSDIAGMRSS